MTAAGNARGRGGAGGGVRLRAATFNIHHGADASGRPDLAQTAAAIAALDADLVGVQEVDRNWSERSAFVDQAVELADRLGVHMAFGPAVEAPRPRPGRPSRRYGVALLSRPPVRGVHNTLLPRPRRGEQRTLLEAEIVVDEAVVRCFTTHLQHRSRVERLAQVETITAILAASDASAVLVGDLNARPGTPEITALTELLVDAWPGNGLGEGHTYTSRRPLARIDYVLTSPAIEVESVEVVFTEASDHLPVIADLRLPVRPAQR